MFAPLLTKVVAAVFAVGVLKVAVAAGTTPPKPVAQAGTATPPPAAQPAEPQRQPKITQEFGENPDTYAKFGVHGHTGRDIGIDCGEPVKAHADGVVKLVGDDPKGYGKFIVSQDNLGYLHMQGHFESIAVGQGAYISKDQEVGKAGSTGNSTGCHEHWGVKGADEKNGFGGYIDPRDWIAMREKREREKSCLYDVPANYAGPICAASEKYNADPALVAAILFWEHRGFEASPETYNWGALCSHAGACGAAQFMPATFQAYGVDGDGDERASRASFKDSVYSAAHLIGKYSGLHADEAKVTETAIKYSCGPSCIGKPLPNETAEYKKAVINLWWKFGSNT